VTESPGIDITVPHPARVYDYWLGGEDNYRADRDAAAEAVKIFPKTVESARSCRAFLSRVVTYQDRACGASCCYLEERLSAQDLGWFGT
jgi:S-adenosyl methyltransferase